jgi:hypothetical protein
MIRRIFIACLILMPFSAQAQGIKLAICPGEFALCAASGTEPVPNKTITVGNAVYPLGHAVCPVLAGPAIADLNLMGGSCANPGPGKVWSLFSAAYSSYPQAPSWDVAPAKPRTFVTTMAPGGGMSNMWSFPCVVRPGSTNGAKLADCFGPLNESPSGKPVPPGTTVITEAAEGSANPVGGNIN